MVLAELAKVAVVALRPDPEFIRDLRRHIQTKIGEGGAARVGLHGQPVIVVGIDESLRDEAMHLDGTVQKFELLCLQSDLAHLETQIQKEQAETSLVHTASRAFIRTLEPEFSPALPRRRGTKILYTASK
jgi:hypothetical protein